MKYQGILRSGLFLLLISCLTISSCKDTPSSHELDPDEDELVLNPNTVNLDELNWLNYVEEIDSLEFTIQFDENFTEAFNWQEDDLLVSVEGRGLLRKILEVYEEDGSIIITTEQGILVDYIQQGRISERFTLGIDNVENVQYKLEGVKLLTDRATIQQHNLHTPASNGLLWDLDIDFLDADGSEIKVYGDYSLETDLIFELDVRFPARLQEFEMSYELNNQLDLGFSAESSIDIDNSLPIAQVTFSPIYISIPGLLAPIVLVPVLNVHVGVNGGISGEISTGISYQNNLNIGTRYTRDLGWNEINDYDENYSFTPPTLGLSADMIAFVNPEYEMALYGVLGGYLSASMYSLIEAATNRDPWWELFVGLHGGVGARATVLSREIFDFDRSDLIDHRWSIAQAESDQLPIVTTESVANITEQGATVEAEVERYENSSIITSRGVCWSEHRNPSLDDDCIEEGDGEGSYIVEITGLNAGTDYYTTAYGTNNAGTAYGSTLNFTTVDDFMVPTVITSSISSITSNSAQSGGEVTDDGGASVTERGVCWSTFENPTTSEDCTTDGSGTGSFTSDIAGLSPDTQYYVRAYAKNSVGTGYGDQKSFITEIEVEKSGTWTRLTDLGGSVRSGAVGFSIDNKGYIGTGFDGSIPIFQKDFWEYDPQTDSWTQKANFGGSARYLAVGFSIGNKGYLGTGFDAASLSYLKDFWEYDPQTNSWTQKADFGGPARGSAVGFSIGNKGYIGTGSDGSLSNLKDFWEYDPQTDSWTQKADFGGPARADASGFSIGNKAYIGTGFDADSLSNLKDFWEYDPQTNSWTQKADFGGPARAGASGFSIGNKGYIGVGAIVSPISQFLNDFWEYDPQTNSWTQKANFGGPARAGASGFSIGNKAYIGTGIDGSRSHRNDFWEFNLEE